MNREAFLNRVREAAAAGRAYRVHLRHDLTPEMGYAGAGDDKAARMAQEVAAVGGHAHLVADLDAAREVLRELLAKYEPQTALCWRHSLLDRLGLDSVLAAQGIGKLDHAALTPLSQAEQRTQMLAADIGITSATHAVAETGSLVMASTPGSERLASLVPPVHIAIIDDTQVLPDLFDLFSRLEADGPERLATNLTLITGPSKTGDLELRLTTGVHGPGKWHVIIIRDSRVSRNA